MENDASQGKACNQRAPTHRWSDWAPTSPLAPAVAVLAGFAVPSMVVAAASTALAEQSPSGVPALPIWFLPLPFMAFFAMPFAAGFLAARIARFQPMMHGLYAGLLGALGFSFALGVESLWRLGVVWMVCSVGGVLGALIHLESGPGAR